MHSWTCAKYVNIIQYNLLLVYIAKCVCIFHLQYFRDENAETLERAAEEKQKIHASMKEADERVKKMASTITALKVCDVQYTCMILCLHYKGHPWDGDNRAHLYNLYIYN